MVEFLHQHYEPKLAVHLNRWITAANTEIPGWAIERYAGQVRAYSYDTDCYVAIVDCMRKLVIEFLQQGRIRQSECCPLIAQFYNSNTIISLPEKQMNLIFSSFSRKMFDYYIERYYMLNGVEYDKKLEKKIARCFQGKGRLRVLFNFDHFRPGNTSESAYISYSNMIPSLFLEQIGKDGPLQVHPDMFQHWGVQRRYNISRYTVFFYAAMVIILCVFGLFLL